MKVIFKDMNNKEDTNKRYTDNEVINFNPDTEIVIENITFEPNKDYVPLITVDEANIGSIGYVSDKNKLFVWFKSMRKSVDGYEIGIDYEPFIYCFHNVNKTLYDGFVNARNKVKYFDDNIRYHFPYHREEIWKG